MTTWDARLDRLRADLGASGRLYAGLGPDGLVFGGAQQALLVIGPPRSGKTSGLVVPNVLCAPGPVVATSTKVDLMEATREVRAGLGRCWLFDPIGAVACPPGVERARWSPVDSAVTWDGALATAHAMVGAARPGVTGSESHWTERAEALLAPLLHASAIDGGDMRLVLRWVLRADAGPAAVALGAGGAGLAADVLAGIVATDGRELSGIWSTAAGVLAAYRSETVLAASSAPNLDPGLVPGGCDTVYLCAPGHQQALVAPIVVGFVEAVRRATYARADLTRPVTLVLDEVANIAPIPGLPAMVSEGGGQGLATMACLQDLSQARQRWGGAADGFLSLFGTKAVLPGVADLATLELVSRLAGEVDVPGRSVSRSPWWAGAKRAPAVTWSTQRRRRLPVDAVNQLPAGRALLLDGHRPPELVGLAPWWSTPPFAPLAGPTAHPTRRRRRVLGSGMGR